MEIEALLYDIQHGDRVRCRACLRQCVIAPGRRGMCRTRENQRGHLYSLIYDRVSSAALDPIEKKPLYHFYPNTQVYSVGSLGCNFTCPGCQNWQISRQTPLEDDPAARHVTPAQEVDAALRARADGICWTYNEPAIWLEHTLESARLAKERGLYTAYVTNGSATRDHLDLIGPYLDAYRVDIKACLPDSYRTISGFSSVGDILDNTQYARERWGMHVECVTNVTPTINDNEANLFGIAHWIATTLGVDTPWHVTRFHPADGLANLPVTPQESLDLALKHGQDVGLRYIYVGNVLGDAHQHTNCPDCRQPLIRRNGFAVVENRLVDGACPDCGTAIAGRWEHAKPAYPAPDAAETVAEEAPPAPRSPHSFLDAWLHRS